LTFCEKAFEKIFNKKELNLKEFHLNIKKEVDKFEKILICSMKELFNSMMLKWSLLLKNVTIQNQ
jgi:hypothetical protein